MHFVLARVHAGTNGTVMKSGSQTKCAGNVPYFEKKRTDTKELYLIFFDKIFEILEKNSKKNRKFSGYDENPQDRDVFTNIYRENNRWSLSP